MLRPMDPDQSDCAKCGIYLQSLDRVPEGGELAWALFFDLNSEIVQRFQMMDQVWQCYELDLTILEFTVLVDHMEAIDLGIKEWHRDNPRKDNGT